MWNSLDGIAGLGWSGSAVVGGYLIKGYGFQACFLVTAAAQLASWLPVVERFSAEHTLFAFRIGTRCHWQR